jgi:hypothetical protein
VAPRQIHTIFSKKFTHEKWPFGSTRTLPNTLDVGDVTHHQHIRRQASRSRGIVTYWTFFFVRSFFVLGTAIFCGP